MATSNPTQRLSLKDADTTAVIADMSIVPSIPILTMPVRSLITPHSAASAIGVALTSELFSMPIRLNDLPRAAQVRNASTKQMATIAMTGPTALEAAEELRRAQKDGDRRERIDEQRLTEGPGRGCGPRLTRFPRSGRTSWSCPHRRRVPNRKKMANPISRRMTPLATFRFWTGALRATVVALIVLLLYELPHPRDSTRFSSRTDLIR